MAQLRFTNWSTAAAMSNAAARPSDDPTPPPEDATESGPRRSAHNWKKKQPFSPGGSEQQSWDQPVSKCCCVKSPNADQSADKASDALPAELGTTMDSASWIEMMEKDEASAITARAVAKKKTARKAAPAAESSSPARPEPGCSTRASGERSSRAGGARR